MTNIHDPNPRGIKLDLNKASVEELSELPMVGRTRAEFIVNYRNEHGPFKSWEDVDSIPGISQGMVDDLKAGGAYIGEKRS